MLTLKDPIHQSLARWRASRHIDIHRYNPITTPRHAIAVMVITTSVRTASHRNYPSGIWHLIIDLSKRRSHLVCKGTGNNHNIGLSRGGTEDYTKSILIVPWGGEMHHFDGATGESEGHGPEGALTGPVGYLIEGCSAFGCQLLHPKELKRARHILLKARTDSKYSCRCWNW